MLPADDAGSANDETEVEIHTELRAANIFRRRNTQNNKIPARSRLSSVIDSLNLNDGHELTLNASGLNEQETDETQNNNTSPQGMDLRGKRTSSKVSRTSGDGLYYNQELQLPNGARKIASTQQSSNRARAIIQQAHLTAASLHPLPFEQTPSGRITSTPSALQQRQPTMTGQTPPGQLDASATLSQRQQQQNTNPPPGKNASATSSQQQQQQNIEQSPSTLLEYRDKCKKVATKENWYEFLRWDGFKGLVNCEMEKLRAKFVEYKANSRSTGATSNHISLATVIGEVNMDQHTKASRYIRHNLFPVSQADDFTFYNAFSNAVYDIIQSDDLLQRDISDQPSISGKQIAEYIYPFISLIFIAASCQVGVTKHVLSVVKVLPAEHQANFNK